MLILIAVGLFNSLGAYSQWQAVKISLSKNSLFTQADDVIGMFLGYLILGETKFLNPGLIAGIILCFGAVGLLVYPKNSGNNAGGSKDSADSSASNLALIKWVAIYSIIWGGAIFAARYFALEKMPFPEFLLGWYSGSFLGSQIIFASSQEGKARIHFSASEIFFIGALAIFIWLSMTLEYWVVNLAPITVSQPVFLVSEATLPVIIGLWIFKEAKSLTNREKLAYIIGIVGVIVIAFSYR